ncbi:MULTISPECIES: hypothetical protein [Streptomyces]|nr:MULTISPECIES: hypothetical protein [Streptomyces]
MFSRYVGTSDDVEAEQSLARGEHLVNRTTDHPHDLRARPPMKPPPGWG